jgi:hypothetical protein
MILQIITNIIKKMIKKLKKNMIFYYELPPTIVFHNYIEKVRFLEKSSFLFLLISKNSIFLTKYLFVDIFIYLVITNLITNNQLVT